jgi:Zn-dependent protease
MSTTLIFTVVIQMLLLLLSISAHEAAHAWVADRCGDSTSRLLGRVSLNPLRHLDPFGSVMLPLLLVGLPLLAPGTQMPVFGWGRPPVVLVKNLRRPYWNALMVSAAGPAVNLLLAGLATVAVGIAAAVAGGDARKAALATLLGQIDDGSGRLAGFPVMFTLVRLATINAFLAAFHLLPLPPLDGGQIALQMLPADWAEKLAVLRPYGLMIGMALAMLWVVPLLVLPFHIILLLVINA